MPDAQVALDELPATAQEAVTPARRRGLSPSTRVLVVLAVAGAVSWLVLFYLRLNRLPDGWWVARDDAVITLSHAKNFADYGSIGVSPGDRVEAFSSPLQFLFAAVVFRIVPLGYRAFLQLFVASTIGATGALVSLVVYFASRTFGIARARAAQLAVGLSVLVAAATLSTWTASGWMVSGMENPLVIVAGLAVAAFALSGSSRLPNTIGAIVSLAMLGIGRVEFAAFVGPLVLATAFVQAQKAPVARRIPVFVLTASVPLAAIAAVHVFRRLYFGMWLPHTAVAQGRPHGRDQLLWLAFLSGTLALSVVAVALARYRGNKLALLARAASTVAFTTVGGAVVWMAAAGRTAGSLLTVLLLPGLIVLLVTLVALTKLVAFVDRRPWLPNFVLAGLVVIPLAQYVVMGPARLEDFRVTSMAIPFLATWAAVAAARLFAATGANQPLAHEGGREIRWMLVPICVLLLAGLVWTRGQDDPRYLNFDVGDSVELLAVADSVRHDELADRGFPILANPDLGKISFVKKAIIVDLGYLGDPMLTQVKMHRPDLMTTYLNEVAAPDVIETHGGWSCGYGEWLLSDGFAAAWTLSDDRWLDGEVFDAGCKLDGKYGVWKRNASAAAEYALTRQVGSSPHPDTIVRAAIEACRAAPGSPFRCEHVTRAALRNVQHLRDRGTLDDVLGALESSPSGPLDVLLVARGPNWGVDAFREFTRLAG